MQTKKVISKKKKVHTKEEIYEFFISRIESELKSMKLALKSPKSVMLGRIEYDSNDTNA